MRKTLALLAFLLPLCLGAQDYSTSWPYLYPDFTEGTVYLANGGKAVYSMNVHILKGRLHYLDNDVIKEAVSSDVKVVRIKDDEYVAVGADILKVVAKEERGLVASLILGQFDKLRESGGAYGSSTTNSATRKLSSIDIGGRVNQNHMELWQSRQSGEPVDVKETYYLVLPGMSCKATRQDVEDRLDEGAKEGFKAWCKENKIKWNKPESLLKLVDFLSK